MREKLKWYEILALAVLLAALAAPAAAQLRTGSLSGRVFDETGTPIPLVSVILSGGGGPLEQMTDSKGEFRFPDLPPGRYTVTVRLEGFLDWIRKRVVIKAGRDTTIKVKLKAALHPSIFLYLSPRHDNRRAQGLRSAAPDGHRPDQQ